MSGDWRSDRARQKRVEQFGGMHPRAGELLGFSEDQPTAEAEAAPLAGWMVAVEFSVKGIGHICRNCRPDQPLGMLPVYVQQLAAREKCKLCATPLEDAATKRRICVECGAEYQGNARSCSCDAPSALVERNET